MPDPGSIVPAIVLAAGMSTRMGRNKLLLEIQGKPMLHWVIDALLAAGLTDVAIVTGHEAELIMSSCARFGEQIRFVHNPDYFAGRASSIRVGLDSLPLNSTGVLITPGDVPFIKPQLIIELVSRFKQTDLITYPMVADRKGHPVIFPSATIPLLLALKCDETLHDYLLANPDQTSPVTWDDPGCLQDFDTPNDLPTPADN